MSIICDKSEDCNSTVSFAVHVSKQGASFGFNNIDIKDIEANSDRTLIQTPSKILVMGSQPPYYAESIVEMTFAD